MATGLYELLGIESTATAEEIRKAYKKRALKTHPDRLPPTATESEKKDSEEKFRAVNQAYEILIDTDKRKEYDFHGSWPPPDVDEAPRPSGSRSRSRSTHFEDPLWHPLFHSHTSYNPFAFSDPFQLFESIFNDFGPRWSGFGFSRSPLDIIMLEQELDRELNGTMSFSPFPFGMLGGPAFGAFLPPSRAFPSIEAQSRRTGSSGSGKWISESYSTQTINGVTQSVHKRRDSDGNEYVTRTYPDGREVYTINGMEQARGQIQNVPNANQLPQPSRRSVPSRSSSLNVVSRPPYRDGMDPYSWGPSDPHGVHSSHHTRHHTQPHPPFVPPSNVNPSGRSHRDRDRADVRPGSSGATPREDYHNSEHPKLHPQSHRLSSRSYHHIRHDRDKYRYDHQHTPPV